MLLSSCVLRRQQGKDLHPGSARGLVPPAVFSVCHSRVTGGADSGKEGSLKLKETGVEKLS